MRAFPANSVCQFVVIWRLCCLMPTMPSYAVISGTATRRGAAEARPEAGPQSGNGLMQHSSAVRAGEMERAASPDSSRAPELAIGRACDSRQTRRHTRSHSRGPTGCR